MVALDLQGVRGSPRPDAEKLPFDKLLLVAGAQPFIPPLPGTDRGGVTTLRTVEDARAILVACREGTRCVCIGGGLLGLETAAGLVRHGADVTLLESHDWLLPRQTNRRAGEILNRYVTAAGIKLRTNAATQAIVGNPRGRRRPAPAGRPHSRRAGRDRHRHPREQPLGSRPDCKSTAAWWSTTSWPLHTPTSLAAGDAAEHRAQVYGIWGLRIPGEIAGLNMAGRGVEFGGVPPSNTLKVLGWTCSASAPSARGCCLPGHRRRRDGALLPFRLPGRPPRRRDPPRRCPADRRGAEGGRGAAGIFGALGSRSDGRRGGRGDGERGRRVK